MPVSWSVSPALGSRPLVVPVPVSPSIRHCDESAGGTRSLRFDDVSLLRASTWQPGLTTTRVWNERRRERASQCPTRARCYACESPRSIGGPYRNSVGALSQNLTQCRQDPTVLRPVSRRLGPDDVAQRCDMHSDVVQLSGRRVATQVRVAVCTGGLEGEVEIASISLQIPRLRRGQSFGIARKGQAFRNGLGRISALSSRNAAASRSRLGRSF